MADDTPTVEQARLELDRAIGRYWPDRQALYRDTVDPAIDALIAAVRAEHAPVEITHCRHCGRACQVDECLDCWRQQREAR